MQYFNCNQLEEQEEFIWKEVDRFLTDSIKSDVDDVDFYLRNYKNRIDQFEIDDLKKLDMEDKHINHYRVYSLISYFTLKLKKETGLSVRCDSIKERFLNQLFKSPERRITKEQAVESVKFYFDSIHKKGFAETFRGGYRRLAENGIALLLVVELFDNTETALKSSASASTDRHSVEWFDHFFKVWSIIG